MQGGPPCEYAVACRQLRAPFDCTISCTIDACVWLASDQKRGAVCRTVFASFGSLHSFRLAVSDLLLVGVEVAFASAAFRIEFPFNSYMLGSPQAVQAVAATLAPFEGGAPDHGDGSSRGVGWGQSGPG